MLSVSPGGAAAEAGLAKGDVIVALDGKTIAGSPSPNRVVVDHMRAVNPDQKVKVRVLRDGKNKDFVVVARPMMGPQPFNIAIPNGGAMGAVMAGCAPTQAMAALTGCMPFCLQKATNFSATSKVQDSP